MRRLNLTNTRFGRLLVIDIAEPIKEGKNGTRGMSKCLCDCGQIITVQNNALKKGDVNSCGCLQKELAKNSIKKVQQLNIKHVPRIGSAKTIWGCSYKDGLSFEDFMIISQKNCFYCNATPSNRYVKTMYRFGKYNIKDATFLYNGIDRINSTLDHNINNAVPCCKYCNFAKLDRTIEEFCSYIIHLTQNKIILPNDHRKLSENIDFSKIYLKENSSLLSTIRSAFKRKSSNYADGNIIVNQFYKLSQLNCYYCNYLPSNILKSSYKSLEKKVSGTFIYNGLDRIDNNKKHNYDNLVACCKYCNASKNNRTLQAFINWIDDLRINLNNWKHLRLGEAA